MSNEKDISKELTDAVNKVLSRRDAVKKAGSIAAGAVLAFLGLGVPGVSNQKKAIACCGRLGCFGTCDTQCMDDCITACSGGCSTSCWGGCFGSCGPGDCCGSCVANCANDCWNACDGWCQFDCIGGCTGGCDTGCYGSCLGGEMG